jgi:hypothetical protein
MYWSIHSAASPEHQARELLNLVYLARRCARLPDVDDEERRLWEEEADRAWTSAKPLLPRLSEIGEKGKDLLAFAARVEAEMTAAV